MRIEALVINKPRGECGGFLSPYIFSRPGLDIIVFRFSSSNGIIDSIEWLRFPFNRLRDQLRDEEAMRDGTSKVRPVLLPDPSSS